MGSKQFELSRRFLIQLKNKDVPKLPRFLNTNENFFTCLDKGFSKIFHLASEGITCNQVNQLTSHRSCTTFLRFLSLPLEVNVSLQIQTSSTHFSAM